MADSAIEWTDKVWNPITGCTKVSAGCANCYAETLSKRFWKNRRFEDVQFHEERLTQPLHWKKPSRIFVNSMSDLFHEKIEFSTIGAIFHVMSACQYHHTFQVLTKRPQRMKEFLDWYHYQVGGPFLPNVWLGVSVENQQTAEERIPILLEVEAGVRFLSVEPMLENIYLMLGLKASLVFSERIHWVICGGESGPRARPFNIEWARDLLKQCKTMGIPFFMKQMGSHLDATAPMAARTGSNRWFLKNKKGGDMAEWPNDLRVREFPHVK
jgi:protein gp37